MATARAEIEIVGDARSFEQATDRASGALASLRNAISSAARTALGFAGGFLAFQGISQAMDFVRDSAIGMNAMLEQSRIGFTTMLGSAQRADRFLRQLADFAAKTPFNFPELQDAARRMLAYGFAAEDVLPILTAVGDATAALGLGSEGIDRVTLALGQMHAKAKVSAEEMLQLTEAGIPAWDILAKGIGVSTAELQKMVAKGVVPADKAIRILIQGMEQRFPNMMQRQAVSWNGLVSNLIDDTHLLIAKAFEPFFNALRDRVLLPLRDTLDRAREAADQSGLGGALLALVPPAVADRLRAIRAEFQPLIDLIGRLTGLWKSASDQIARSGGDMLRPVNQAMRGVHAPSDIAAPVGGIVQQLVTSIQTADWSAVGRAVGEGIVSGISAIANLGARIGQALLRMIQQVNWLQLGLAAAPALVNFLIGLISVLTDPTRIIPILVQHWDIVLPMIVGALFMPAKWFKWIVEGLRGIPIVGPLLAWLTEGIFGTVNRLGVPVRATFRELGSRFVSGIRLGWAGEAPKLFPTVLGHITQIVAGLRARAASFLQAGLSFAERLGSGLGGGLGWVRNQVIRLINVAIDGPIGSAIGTVRRIGAQIIDGLWSGIASLARSLASRVSSFVKTYVVDPIRRIIRPGSPSRLTMEYGQAMVEGLALGIDQRLSLAAAASTRLALAAAMPMTPGVTGVAAPPVVRERVIERRTISDAVVVLDGRIVGRLVAPHVNESLAERQGIDQRAIGYGVVVTAR